MPARTSDIPVGTQFSPNLIDLPSFLAAATKHSGDIAALKAAVWRKPVRKRGVAKVPTARRGMLPLEAAAQYGLLSTGSYETTPLTRELATLVGAALYDAFATHILLKLGGLRVVEAAQQMEIEKLAITGDSLARYLTAQGFVVIEHNTAINSIRLWLSLAGVFGARGWAVDPIRKAALVGLDDDSIAGIVGLRTEQRAFLIALCRINPAGSIKAADVRNLAEVAILGHTFARASLPKAVLQPLKDLGLINFRTRGTSGGKSATLTVTSKFIATVLEPFLESAVKTLDTALTAYFKKPLAETYAELSSTNPLVKGRALEAYAIHVMRLLGLRFVEWRKRANDTTARAEIDVLMTGMVGYLVSRWQIQCKNTPGSRVDLEDVAKEIGLLPVTKATHVLMLANCPFTKDARWFARSVMESSPVFIYLLDAADFNRIRARPSDLAVILQQQSEAAAALKQASGLWKAE